LSESGFTGFENWQDFIPIKKNLSAYFMLADKFCLNQDLQDLKISRISFQSKKIPLHISCWLKTRERVKSWCQT
jgi:hypothetical protein